MLHELFNSGSVVYNVNMKKILIYIFTVLFFINFSESCFAADNYIEMKKNIKVLYNANKLKEAYSLILQMEEEIRDAEIWLLAANITQDYGRDLDAIYLLQKSVSTDPKYYKAYYNLGNIYLKDNKFNSAIYNYKKCVRYNNNFAYGWYNLGNAYMALDEYGKAKSAYLKAVSIKNNEPDFYYNLALAYKKLNKNKQAQKILDKYNMLNNNTDLPKILR